VRDLLALIVCSHRLRDKTASSTRFSQFCRQCRNRSSPCSLQPLLTKQLSRSLSHAVELSNTAPFLVQPPIIDHYSVLHHTSSAENAPIEVAGRLIRLNLTTEKEQAMSNSLDRNPMVNVASEAQSDPGVPKPHPPTTPAPPRPHPPIADSRFSILEHA
jgi:hypothetical protein